MTILIAPDKFKGSLNALQVCKAIERGIHKQHPNIKCLLHPLADGGEGSIDILNSQLALQKIDIETLDPLGQPIKGHYYQNEEAAFIELATASGLHLLSPKQQDPLLTSTEGTGLMILDAIKSGYRKIYLFIGGSATNDAAMGIAHALGYRFFDQNNHLLSPKGKNLSKIACIQKKPLLFDKNKVYFTLLCDVNNPLFGKNGAAHIYARQKGASPSAIRELDCGLRHFAHIIRQQYGKDLSLIVGGGAAGGVAAGMSALFNTSIQNGIQAIMQITNFEQKVQQSDLIISGEGQLDLQTLSGKVVQQVARLARQYRRPLFLFVGKNKLTTKEATPLHAQKIKSILDHAKDEQAAINKAAKILEEMAFSIPFFTGGL